MSDRVKHVVVIGGGITGLAAAHRLLELRKQNEFNVTLLESSSQLGGVIQTTKQNGFLIESGADSFISEKPAALELARRLGLESRLIETNQQHRRSFIVRGGKLRPVPEGFQLMAPARFWPFVTTDIFSWSGKARMALEPLIPRRADANGVDDETLAAFVRRRLGREAFERMAQPMIGGIYTADPEKLSLRATLPRFLEMERHHGSVLRALWRQRKANRSTGVSGARYSLFMSFDRGMQVLIDALAERLRAVARLNARVSSLRRNEERNGWTIQLEDGSLIQADLVCLAVPAFTAASLLANVKTEIATLLNEIPYASTATTNLGYRRADVAHLLDGFGFVVPFIENRSVLACTFSSTKFPGRAPDSHVLLRAFAGGALQPEIFALSESDLVDRVCNDLRDLLGITKPPLFTLVKKWERSMPQYHVGHLDRVSKIRAELQSLPGFYVAGNSYDGAGVPDCIRSGETAAEILITDLGV